MTRKNGKVELLRFIFAMLIVLFHVSRDFWGGDMVLSNGYMTFAKHGYIGVEFFFIVSGILLGAHLSKLTARSAEGAKGPVVDASGRLIESRPGQLAKMTYTYVWQKVKAILPYHLFFYLLMFPIYKVVGREINLRYFLDKLGGLFLIQHFGLHGNVYGTVLVIEWFLASQFLAIIIIYPLALKFGKNFRRLVAPVVGVMIICYLMTRYGFLSGTEGWGIFTYRCHLRAIAEMLIGLSLYEVVEAMKSRASRFRLSHRIWLTIAECVCYLAVFGYVFSTYPKRYEAHMVFFLAVALTITFSGQGLLGSSRVFDNKICYFLGAISLPIYLGQNVARRLLPVVFEGAPEKLLVTMVVAGTILTGVLAYLIWTSIVRTVKKASP